MSTPELISRTAEVATLADAAEVGFVLG